jgi:hypothetical protein
MDIIYNKKCNKYFNINLYDKYNVYFYSNNKLNFIILKHKNKENIPDELWVTYTICCVYDMNKNIILKGKDMIIIEKDIIDNSLIIDDKKIRNINDLEEQIRNQIFNNKYIGYIKTNIKNNIFYFYLIKDIIKE